MSEASERRRWSAEDRHSSADRLIDWLHGLFLAEPVAASAAVMLLAGAASNSGAVGAAGFVAAMLVASHLRRRYERFS